MRHFKLEFTVLDHINRIFLFEDSKPDNGTSATGCIMLVGRPKENGKREWRFVGRNQSMALMSMMSGQPHPELIMSGTALFKLCAGEIQPQGFTEDDLEFLKELSSQWSHDEHLYCEGKIKEAIEDARLAKALGDA